MVDRHGQVNVQGHAWGRGRTYWVVEVHELAISEGGEYYLSLYALSPGINGAHGHPLCICVIWSPFQTHGGMVAVDVPKVDEALVDEGGVSGKQGGVCRGGRRGRRLLVMLGCGASDLLLLQVWSGV